ncbi:hypothetical protein DBV15_07531 [Temnothorax longispinosus]|uniref:Uncharacterized protein n=1 Tax=Temnothorax longispinosus TaxID=300112 RepID=A0A4S2JX62_9HYME|nr:hypothetical protein DBV15_07531 [Temnothorax longispinosus]
MQNFTSAIPSRYLSLLTARPCRSSDRLETKWAVRVSGTQFTGYESVSEDLWHINRLTTHDARRAAHVPRKIALQSHCMAHQDPQALFCLHTRTGRGRESCRKIGVGISISAGVEGESEEIVLHTPRPR